MCAHEHALAGSHVAATAVGRAVGVASGARVVAVRVLDCQGSGSISDVVSGGCDDTARTQ